MNKAFELILDRLEERTDFLSDCTKYGNKDAEQQEKSYSTMMLYEVADLVEDLKTIVQEVAEEYNNDWIPCSERLPYEHETMFAKLKGTDKFDSAMPEKISDDVNVTVEFEDGTRKTKTMHTIDGKWKTDINIVKFNVIAWQPLPKPYQQKGE